MKKIQLLTVMNEIDSNINCDENDSVINCNETRSFIMTKHLFNETVSN